MKGYLIKDARLMWHNKRLFFTMLFVMLFALYQSGAYSFIIGYVTMIGILFAITTMSYDEYDKSIVYLMTLPAGRTAYVAEKYVLMFGCGLTGAVLSSFLCVMLYRDIAMQILMETAVIYLVMLLLQLIMLPLQLKFGGEKGRVVLIAVLACAMVIITSLRDILSYFFGSYEAGLRVLDEYFEVILSLPAAVIGIIVFAIYFIFLAISFLISRKIVGSREF